MILALKPEWWVMMLVFRTGQIVDAYDGPKMCNSINVVWFRYGRTMFE